MSGAYVSATFEDDDDAGTSDMVDQALRMGQEAWAIAADLRAAYGLSPADSKIEQHDFIDWMWEQTTQRKGAQATLMEDRKARQEALTGTAAEQPL